MQTPDVSKIFSIFKKKSEALEKFVAENIHGINKYIEDVCWYVHDETNDEQILPVPRLEVVLTDESPDKNYRSWMWKYSMVYWHIEGHYEIVPLGWSKSNSSQPNYIDNLNSSIPWRLASYVKHDMDHLKLPAFLVYGDKMEKVTQENIHE